jgi:hypothetical protein
MGAWSHEAFGNDTALDWVCGLAEVHDLSLVEAAIAGVVDAPGGGRDASAGCEALAAAEVVACLRGHAGDIPESVSDWAARTRLTPPAALTERVLLALDRVGGDESELKQLWDDSDSADDWQASLVDLRKRLLAPVRPLPAPLDDIAKVARGVVRLNFTVPALPPEDMARGPFAATVRPRLYSVIVAAEVLGDTATVREGIARMWHLVDPQAGVKVLWDLAVREAKAWAAEGELAVALAGLEPWRQTAEALAPGTFDMRVMSVYQEAGDYEQAEQARARLIAAGHGATMQWLDKALLEARAGSADAARSLLKTHQQAFSTDALKPWIAFAQGILAARDRQPEALTLLTPWVEARATQCAQGAAVWGFFGIGAGWWALALCHAGRQDAARTVVAAIRPVLLTPENALLIGELQAAGLMDEAAPTRPRASPPAAGRPGVQSDHGVFRTITVRGVNALKQVEAYRRSFAAGGGLYPFLIGDDEDLAMLLQGLEPGADDGRAVIAASRGLDVDAWLRQRGAGKPPRWSASGDVAPNAQLHALFDVSSRRLKPSVTIGLVPVDQPEDLFARLGYGNWNDCPSPAEHVALHRSWRARFGAEPVVVSHDVVECLVARPVADRKAALALAVEQGAYCGDIVEQGVGSVAALAATLLDAPVWYFWWD